MDTADNSDRFDALLGRRDVGEQADGLRRAVFAQTAPVLRRRRVARRCAWAMAFAGCYLAGAVSASVWSSQARHAAPLLATNSAKSVVRGDETSIDLAGSDLFDGAKQQGPQTPQPGQSRFETLRNAGGVALRDQGDVEAAIRLYAQALRVATPQELTISAASDDWLLMSLKEAHTQESTDDDRSHKS